MRSKALVVRLRGRYASGHREVIGIDLGETESEAFWVAFLRSLVGRSLAGVRLAISDHHEGLKRAIARILACPWQRCTVHFVRDVRATAAAPSAGSSPRRCGRSSTPRARSRRARTSARCWSTLTRELPQLAALLETAEEDLLAFYRFPQAHWSKLQSTNPLERLNKEIGRRWVLVGIFPNDASAIRLRPKHC